VLKLRSRLLHHVLQFLDIEKYLQYSCREDRNVPNR